MQHMIRLHIMVTPFFHPIKAGTMKKDILHSEIPSQIDNEITEVSQRIMIELESASSKDLSEARYAKKYCNYLISIIRKIYFTR